MGSGLCLKTVGQMLGGILKPIGIAIDKLLPLRMRLVVVVSLS